MRKERKNEALLWFGKWTSKLGNIVFDYANSVSIVGAFSHAPWVLALYQSSETMIQIVFNLIGGAKADSGSRKRILIVTDILAAAICFAVSFFVASPRMAEVVIAANALLAVVYAFNSPTYRSIVREMIDAERIGIYNSISNGGGEVIKIAGPMAGMLLVRWIGVRGALLFDALTFLLSAVSEMLLTPVSDAQKKAKEKKNIFRDIAEGFTYLVRERQLLFLILLSALVNFFLAGFNLLCPYTDVMYASFGIEFYSKVLIMEAAGGLLGSFISSRLGSRVKENARLMVLFLGAMGVALALEPLAAITGSALVCLLPFLLSGTALTVFNIQFMSYVQLKADEAYLGRVFSIIFTVAVLFMPVGSLAFSFLLDTSSPAGFAVVGGGIIALAAAGMLIFRGSTAEAGK